jgi:hypothetical protein
LWGFSLNPPCNRMKSVPTSGSLLIPPAYGNTAASHGTLEQGLALRWMLLDEFMRQH